MGILLLGAGATTNSGISLFSTPLAVVNDGDSITLGFGATYGYPEYFASSSNVAKHNLGVAGRQLGTMLSNYAGNVAPLYSATGFNALTVDGGTNDIFNGMHASDLETAIQSYCSAARATGYKVYVSTLISRADAGWTGAMETDRTTYNTWLRANILSFADGLIDFDGISQTQNPANATYFQADELHPTDALQSIMGTYLQGKFTALPLSAYVYNTTPLAGSATFLNTNKAFSTTNATATTVYASASSISGQKVFAAVLETWNASGNAAIGIGTSASTNANGIGFDVNKSVGYYDNGSIIQNSSFALGAGTLPTYTASYSLVGVVVDTVAQKMWITRDGVNFYGGSGSALTAVQVAAGTGGYSWAAISGTVFPLMGSIVATGYQWRSIAYPWSPPSGYSEL